MSFIVLVLLFILETSQVQADKVTVPVSKVESSNSRTTFKKGTIQIGNAKLKAEFALTSEEHQMGLMNRTEIPENFGMLFIFDDEAYRSFWMKNTFINLSIAYIGSNKKILEIIDMKAVKSSLDVDVPSYPSSVKAKYALEVNQGWFKKNKIKVGDKMKSFTYK